LPFSGKFVHFHENACANVNAFFMPFRTPAAIPLTRQAARPCGYNGGRLSAIFFGCRLGGEKYGDHKKMGAWGELRKEVHPKAGPCRAIGKIRFFVHKYPSKQGKMPDKGQASHPAALSGSSFPANDLPSEQANKS